MARTTKNPGRRSQENRDRGFSAAEMLLVVALSGVVFVGLAALIDVPQRMAERENHGTPSIASADTALATLDQDVRYATTVRVPSATRVEADQADGRTIAWEIVGGAEKVLERTADGSTVPILRNIAAGSFALETARTVRRHDESRALATAAVSVASFNAFALRSGYAFGAGGRGVTGVSVVSGQNDIDSVHTVGIYFAPGSLGGDRGVPTAIRLKLQRNGSEDLLLQIFEASPTTRLPNRSVIVANGRLYNRQIPLALSDVSVPLAMTKKLDPSKSYFVEMHARGGAAAKIDTQTLSVPAAAQSAASTFFYSNDGGTSYAALGSSNDASQTRFTFDALKVSITTAPDDADGLPPGFDAVDVGIGVVLHFTLSTAEGPESLATTVPIVNNLPIVNP